RTARHVVRLQADAHERVPVAGGPFPELPVEAHEALGVGPHVVDQQVQPPRLRGDPRDGRLDLLVVVVLAFHRTDLAGRARGRLHGGPEPVRGPAGHVHDPPRVGERGGHALAHAPAAAGDQCDPGAHESAPAVAAPGTASTSGNVTVASSSDRVTDQPGVNRHSAITQRSSSTTYTSEYSPVESVSVPWSRST